MGSKQTAVEFTPCPNSSVTCVGDATVCAGAGLAGVFRAQLQAPRLHRRGLGADHPHELRLPEPRGGGPQRVHLLARRGGGGGVQPRGQAARHLGRDVPLLHQPVVRPARRPAAPGAPALGRHVMSIYYTSPRNTS